MTRAEYVRKIGMRLIQTLNYGQQFDDRDYVAHLGNHAMAFEDELDRVLPWHVVKDRDGDIWIQQPRGKYNSHELAGWTLKSIEDYRPLTTLCGEHVDPLPPPAPQPEQRTITLDGKRYKLVEVTDELSL